jgi:hypothetical protein
LELHITPPSIYACPIDKWNEHPYTSFPFLLSTFLLKRGQREPVADYQLG